MTAPAPAASTSNGAVAQLPSTTETPADGEGLRLRLKPSGPPTGHVDGAWWPRSPDLATEIVPLIAGVADRIGPVETVAYGLAAWEATDRRMEVDGRRVRLAGYRSQRPHTIDLIGAQHRLTLLVVAPDTDADAAERALTASVDGDGTVAELLA